MNDFYVKQGQGFKPLASIPQASVNPYYHAWSKYVEVHNLFCFDDGLLKK